MNFEVNDSLKSETSTAQPFQGIIFCEWFSFFFGNKICIIINAN